MSKFVGKKNSYSCQTCGSTFITVDRDDGTTPMTTKCQKAGCNGHAESGWYLVDQTLEPTHEWYRASDSEARGMNAGSRQHHQMGGLFLRKKSVSMTLRRDITTKLT